MQLRYALHERTSPNGYAWTWRAGGMEDSLLKNLIYHSLFQMPDDATTIRPKQVRGGILKFAAVHDSKVDQHVVLYRFYDGGSDDWGRSRVTMLTAWTTPDQFPAPPTANGVLELFHKQMFEDLSNKARTIGIEQPYSLICDEPLTATTATPSAALAEFLHGLADADHDYSLTIQNDHHVQKTPSAAFKYREAEAAKRQREKEQLKADQDKREVEETKRQDGEGKPEVNVTLPSAEKHNRWISTPIKILICLTLIGISALGFVMWKDLLNPPEFPAAQKIVDLFQQLPRDDQQQVFNELQRIMKKGSQKGPMQKSTKGE